MNIQTAATKVTNMLYLASGVRLPCSLTNQNLFGSVSFACGKSEFLIKLRISLDIPVERWYFNNQALEYFKVLTSQVLVFKFMEELLWIQEFQAKQDY